MADASNHPFRLKLFSKLRKENCPLLIKVHDQYVGEMEHSIGSPSHLWASASRLMPRGGR